MEKWMGGSFERNEALYEHGSRIGAAGLISKFAFTSFRWIVMPIVNPHFGLMGKAGYLF